MTLVVGICGPAGSGKTTVAKYLERHYGARSYALADPIKLIVQRAFNLSREHLWGTQAQKEAIIPGMNMSGRGLMQRIGTSIKETFGEDFWVERTMAAIRRDAPVLAVVEDVRYPHEAAGIRPAWIWKLPPWGDRESDSHSSETSWQRVQEDHLIVAPRPGLDILYRALDEACAKFNILPVLNAIEAP